MRRILAVTSGRADATPMAPVLAALEGWCEVEVADLSVFAASSCARAVEPYFVRHNPDVLLLLGDRFELLGAALIATTLRVPIAHIHGGEASFGSFDNQIRDAVTKLSHVHFVAAKQFAARVHSMGEHPSRIHVVGAPGLDNLTNLPERKPEKYFVATYHPATLETESGIFALIEALNRFPDYEVIWTGANNDPGSDKIREALSGRPVRIFGTARDYHLACRHAGAVVGNSSSGLIEAPALEVPTVNIGRRQEGRPSGPSVFDCPEHADAIQAAITAALRWSGPFTNPYGKPGASAKIAKVLSEIDLDGILVKRWTSS